MVFWKMHRRGVALDLPDRVVGYLLRAEGCGLTTTLTHGDIRGDIENHDTILGRAWLSTRRA